MDEEKKQNTIEEVTETIPGNMRTMEEDVKAPSPIEMMAKSGNFPEDSNEEEQSVSSQDSPDPSEHQMTENEDFSMDVDLSESSKEQGSPVEREASADSPKTLSMSDLGMELEPQSELSMPAEEKIQPNPSEETSSTSVSPAVTTQASSPAPSLKASLGGLSLDDDDTPSKKSKPSAMPSKEPSDQSSESFDFDMDDKTDNDTEEDLPKATQSSSSLVKVIAVFSIFIVAGVAFYVLQPVTPTLPSLPFFGNNDTSSDDTLTTDPTDDNTTAVQNEARPFVPDSTLEVTVDPSTIRSSILTELANESATLIQIDLRKDTGEAVSFQEFTDFMGVSIPAEIRDQLTNSWIFAYNQDGIYKIASILYLESSQVAPLVQTWSASIPGDMTGFSLSSTSRGVTTPDINSTELTLPGGGSTTNYFYNYSDVDNSVDVTSVDSYILIASSQDTMQYLISSFQNN